ncbi:MAG: hypothetical protein JXP34_14425, partial [Planctomycetes bacterium]|nr:hypothetical protein [Planctomycetota bacterium]
MKSSPSSGSLVLGGVFLVLLAGGTASAQFDANGFVNDWLLLGELLQPNGGAPGVANIQLDYLADGLGTTEVTVLPEEGEVVEIEYGVASAATGLHATSAPLSDPDGDGNPEWIRVNETDGHLDFVGIFGQCDDTMTYAATYVINSSAQPREVILQGGSDDGDQIYINVHPVWLKNVGGGYGAGAVLDQFKAVLAPGKNRVLAKIFQGAGGHSFGLRFADAASGAVLTSPDLDVTLDPAGWEPSGVSAKRDLPAAVPLAPQPVGISLAAVGSPAGDVTIIERIPPDWVASSISDGGTAQGGAITWTVAAASLPRRLTYAVQAPDDVPGAFAGAYWGAGVAG